METNEDVFAYGLETHPHVPEMERALELVWGRKTTLAFTPHLVPMSRGILATCYARPHGTVQTSRLYDAARACYEGEPFVKVVLPTRAAVRTRAGQAARIWRSFPTPSTREPAW